MLARLGNLVTSIRDTFSTVDTNGPPLPPRTTKRNTPEHKHRRKRARSFEYDLASERYLYANTALMNRSTDASESRRANPFDEPSKTKHERELSDDIVTTDAPRTRRQHRSPSQQLPQQANPLDNFHVPLPEPEEEEVDDLLPAGTLPPPDRTTVKSTNPMTQKKAQAFSTKNRLPSGHLRPHNSLDRDSGSVTQTKSQYFDQTLQRSTFSVPPNSANKRLKLDSPFEEPESRHSSSLSSKHSHKPSRPVNQQSKASASQRPSSSRSTRTNGSMLEQQNSAGRDSCSAGTAIVRPRQSRANIKTVLDNSADQQSEELNGGAHAETVYIDTDDEGAELNKASRVERKGSVSRPTTPRETRPESHRRLPSESPDALQDESGRHAAVSTTLKSPKVTIRAQEKREARLAGLIVGNPNSTKLRGSQQHSADSRALIQFNMVQAASTGLPLAPAADYYNLVVDPDDRVIWVNVSDTRLKDVEPVKGPIRINDISHIDMCQDGPAIARLRFRGVNGAPQEPLIFEMKGRKTVNDFIQEVQKLDSLLTIQDREANKLEKEFQRILASATRQSSSRSESEDNWTAGSKLNLAEKVKETARKKFTSAKREAPKLTRASLDGPRQQGSVITGADRMGALGPPPRQKGSTSGRVDQDQSYDLPTEEAASEAHPVEQVSRRPTRTTRAQRLPSPSPPAPVLKFSKTGGLGEVWKSDLVYPPEGKKKAAVDFASMERLDDDEFLNDTIINFFLRYLQHQVELTNPQLATKVHFFNTYFLENLSKGAKKGGINYQAVKSWTKNINLFTRDYVIIPVNENLHWYAVIVCNLPAIKRRLEVGDSTGHEVEETDIPPVLESDIAPGNTAQVANETQESFEELRIEEGSPAKARASAKRGRKKKAIARRKYATNEPVIITLDSLGAGRSATCKLVKDYIAEEAKVRLPEVAEEINQSEIKAMTAKEIPLQENFSDCGLFLCTYLEQFINNPDKFVHTILQRTVDFGWPNEVKGSDLRTRLRSLIMELHREQEGQKGREEVPALGKIMVDMRGPVVQVSDSPLPINDNDDNPVATSQQPNSSAKQPSVADVPRSGHLPQPAAETTVREASQLPSRDPISEPAQRKTKVAAPYELPNPPTHQIPRPNRSPSVEVEPPAKQHEGRDFLVVEDDSESESAPPQPRRKTHAKPFGATLDDGRSSPRKLRANTSPYPESISTDYLTTGRGHLQGITEQIFRNGDLRQWEMDSGLPQGDVADSQDTMEIPETQQDEISFDARSQEERAGEDEII